jgi:hypothetical protein
MAPAATRTPNAIDRESIRICIMMRHNTTIGLMIH